MTSFKFNSVQRGIAILSVIICGVASFGLTFHFFGQSSLVPEPSRQFGFLALAPLAVIDKIYQFIAGSRLFWDPIPMFMVLWGCYSIITILVAFWILKTRNNRN